VDPHHAGHIHEPDSTMTIPLVILAVLSLVAGYLGIPEFLAPVFPETAGAAVHHGPAATGIMAIATLLGLIGIAAAYYLYVQAPGLPDRLAQQWHRLYRLSLNKWFVDEAYDRAVVKPTFEAADSLWRHVDVAVIDGAVNGVARTIGTASAVLRLIQSGQTQHYALGMTLGTAIIAALYLLW
jgi:NADH-quinone oxidoreductase subunit L